MLNVTNITPTTRTAIRLRPYQHEAIAAIDDAARRGIRRQLVVLPTGTGKTVVFSESIRQRGGRALVLAHRDELIEQTVAKLRLIAPACSLGVVKAERDEHTAAIVVASVQTLARPQRLARMATDWTTVVVDEAHHATADSYRRILDHHRAGAPDGPLLVGFTATADRADGLGLDRVFTEIVFARDLLTMMRSGFLCDLRAVQVTLDVDLDGVHTRAGDFAIEELDAALTRADAPHQALEAYRQHASGRRGLIFTPSVASAHAMAHTFAAGGLRAEAIDGGMPLETRRAILARLHSGETEIIANCAVLTEGFDEPPLACIVIARPTQSRPLYVQMIGRGSRVYPGKPDCLVLDLVGATSRHPLMTIAALFGLAPKDLAGATVTGALETRARQAAAHADRLAAHGALISKTVDLFAAAPLPWVKATPQRFVLPLGDAGQLLLLSDDLETWRVVHVDRRQRSRTLARELDLAYAHGRAEDVARRLGAATLISRQAPWRQEPASEKQRLALGKWRITIPPGCTKGVAADLLAAAIARVS